MYQLPRIASSCRLRGPSHSEAWSHDHAPAAPSSPHTCTLGSLPRALDECTAAPLTMWGAAARQQKLVSDPQSMGVSRHAERMEVAGPGEWTCVSMWDASAPRSPRTGVGAAHDAWTCFEYLGARGMHACDSAFGEPQGCNVVLGDIVAAAAGGGIQPQCRASVA
jgi:hypothetical protein